MTNHLPSLPDAMPVHAAFRLLSDIGRINEVHSVQVAKISLEVFDSLKNLHGFGEEVRVELACAALLHDLGVSFDEANHHKMSRDLIMERFWVLPPHRRARVALMARYHRKSLPKENHSLYRDLCSSDRRIVWAGLSALRLADGLDRTHRALVQWLRLKSFPGKLEVSVSFSAGGEDELIVGKEKSDALEKFYQCKVILCPFDLALEWREVSSMR